MIVFPVRTAGEIFPAARLMGKFQGTIPTTTPRGVYLVMTWRSSVSSVISSGSSKLEKLMICLEVMSASNIAH